MFTLNDFRRAPGGVMVGGEEFIPAMVKQFEHNTAMVSPIIFIARTGRWVYQISVHPEESWLGGSSRMSRPSTEVMVARPPFYTGEGTIIQVASRTGGLVGRYLSFLPGGYYQVRVFTDLGKFLRWASRRSWLLA